MVNSCWGKRYSLSLIYKVRLFYHPQEFSSVIITIVCIPPQSDKTCVLDDPYGAIQGLESTQPEACIVAGDFNLAVMSFEDQF